METQTEFTTEKEQVDFLKMALCPKVLVVEDDITSEPIWEYILQRVSEKTLIMWATSVNEADHMIRDAVAEGRPFDLVITDIFLSGSLTGIDLWQRFHTQMPTSIVIMSAIEPMKVQKYFRGLGDPVYLQKPLNMHKTIETVYELLQRPRA